MARRRTTIEIDEQLLARAKQALGAKTTRAAVEKALRQAASGADDALRDRAEVQRRYLTQLSTRVDVEVLTSEQMWR